MDLQHLQHAVGQNVFHFVWKIKYAMNPFKFYGLMKDCERFIYEVSDKHGCTIYELKVAPDHVHLFVQIPHTMSVSKALQFFKGYTAFKLFRKHPWLRRYFPKGHFWSPGKFFRSVGNTTAEAVQHCIVQSQGAWNF